MPTYSAYNPEVVQLIGGLDFVTPRPSTAPGALIDCYNFEVADKLGYKRVDGVEPFDGSFSISNVYTLLYSSNWTSNSAATLIVGQGLYLDGDTSQQTFAIVTSVTANMAATAGTVTYYISDINKFYYMFGNPSAIIHNSVPTPANISLTDTALTYQFANKTTIASAVAAISAEYQKAFDTINICTTTAVEGGHTYYNPSIGLVWFKEQEYSVNDLNSILFDTGTIQFYPGDYFGILSSGQEATCRIQEVILYGGDWSTGDAKGKLLYSDFRTLEIRGGLAAGSTIYIHSTTTDTTPGGAAAILRNSLTSITATPTDTAGLFRSYNIDQIGADVDDPQQDQGWKEVDLGYTTQYKNGNSLFGGFNRVGRDPNPPASALTPTAYSFPSTGSSNLVNSGATTTQWQNQGAFPANIQTQNDGNFIFTTSNSSGIAELSLTDFGFSDLPTDALITGIELSISAAAPPKTTTTGTFTMTLASHSVTVAATANLNGNFITITDGTNTCRATVTAAGGGSITFTVTAILAGISGNTMASGAIINYTESNRKLNANLTLAGSTTRTTTPIVGYLDSATDTFTFGGSNDLWGSSVLNASNLQDVTFGVNLWASGNGTPSLGRLQHIDLDVVKMRIFYQTSSSVYYFYNGTDDVQGVITTFTVDDGTDFADGNASGIIQIANVEGINGATRNTIFDGDAIWTAPGGTGDHIADVVGNMTYAGLPSYSQLVANNSQYEFITADFYGNTEWEAIYGVSGAGRAFTYDSFYFRYIYANPNAALDIPRHLAFHNFQLALGYKSGDLEVSATGLPEDFTGIDGAVDLSTGDPITGLLRMSGTTLGIFCRSSIQALNGTDPTNFSMSVLNPYEGALEYTVVDGGNSKPIYTSYKGISTFDQSNTYGNFLGSRLSANITPWLLPRLNGTAQPVNVNSIGAVAASRGPLFATTIRNKNQYRLWFADGYYLTMTLMGQTQDPVFTIQQVNFSPSNNIDILNGTGVAIPLAHSSSIDANGRDRNHFSIYNPAAGKPHISTDYANFVWEIDRGWGFGPVPIIAWFTTTHNFFDNPFEIDNPRKCRLHGQSLGLGTLDLSVSADYESGDFQFGTFSATSNAPAQDISLPRSGGTANPMFLTSDYQAQTNIANIGKRGRSFSLQFSTDPGIVEPPTVCQALLIQTTLNKADA